MRASAALDQVRIVTGIESLNLVPRGLPDKGSATLRACERFQCDKALFVGDDQTDEDAFSADPARILGVRIGRSERSGASYCLRNQLEIDLLLGRLVELHGEWSN